MIGSTWLYLASFAVMLAVTRAVRCWTWLYALSALSGTLAYEVMHWMAGWLFGARPISVSVLPRRVPDGEPLLGRMLFIRLCWWNAAPMALVPFPLIPLGADLLRHSASWSALAWLNLGLKFLVAQCLLATWPSSYDWWYTLGGAVVTGTLTLIGLYLCNCFGFTLR